MYRDDALTGTLERVSVGEGGYDANGNTDVFADDYRAKNYESHNVYQQQNMWSRAISEDGSQIVFSTAEPLSREASNGVDKCV